MPLGKHWTDQEEARVDQCVRLGLAASMCLARFPERSYNALHCKFSQRRKALGVVLPNARPREVRRVEPEDQVSPREGAVALLRAHLRTGKHWITDPARFAAACQSVAA